MYAFHVLVGKLVVPSSLLLFGWLCMAACDPGSKTKQGPQQQVPVELTSLLPVRVVSVHGDFFDTELHQDAPMRILQQAVEDCFKVRPELQLLTHNRQQINPNLSLRKNGCLLLKGDPYVKIVVDIKKGTRLNLVCQVPHHEPIPLACEGAETVWDVKKKLCTALSKTELTPQRIRLFWRYWELNDKATLDYYQLPTNAKISVMKKRGFVAKLQPQRKLRRTGVSVALEEEGKKIFSGADMVETPRHRSSIEIEMQPQMVTEPTASVSPWPAPLRQLGHAVIPIDPAAGHSATGSAAELASEARVCPAKDAEPAKIATSSELLEIAQLKQEVASLERRIAAYGVDRADYELLEESYRATLGRVAELESTMGRFQHLLQRALTLM
ncbi:hypothetical protein MOQ_006077 [Trypanosoma cruzi marinkellei]|uniref:Ubiquitin-like domain-containing protein n=1 Tax=Trypanosoma cruzi marinkellei TaxID=85056 RepID=K2NMQ9_TRYCR|nr:hypothetical protein MOQ_006077 [Trypanosoma cruzi marinkellei]